MGFVTRQFSRTCGSNQYYDSYYNRCVTRSTWDWWGRWVLAGIVILAFFIIVPLFCCVTARRRRRRGITPMYGTGWMANGTTTHGNYQNNPQAYNAGNQNYAPPPPQYAPSQQTGGTYNSNDGYYGGGVQQPNNAYNPNRGVGEDYAPPPGPPPAKHG